jgi:hypothetical protein
METLDRWRDPVFNERHEHVPRALAARLTDMAGEIAGRHVYYERMHALLAVAGIAAQIDPASLRRDEAPSDAEKQLGAVLSQAFHQGCALADVALAADIPPAQVIEIGQRTIRRAGWLKPLY